MFKKSKLNFAASLLVQSFTFFVLQGVCSLFITI